MSTHPDLYNSLAYLLERNVPGFVKTDHETFLAFLEAYFEWMEQTGQTQEILTQFKDYKDIDHTVDSFLEYFRKNYFQTIPKKILADKRLLAKHIRDFYSAKGAVPAYKLLFRIIFNEGVELYYPGDDVLRASDGHWTQDKVIHTTSNISGTISDIIESTQVVGKTSNAIADVELALRTQHSTNGNIFFDYAESDTPTTCVRASSATRTNSSGYLETVATNTARIDYDADTLEKIGLLIEPARTNKLFHSNDISNVVWFNQRVTVVTDNTASPYNTNDADKILATAVSGTHYVSQMFSVTNGQSYSLSFYAKQAELKHVRLKFTDAHFDDFAFATFDLENGVIHEQGAGLLDAAIEVAANGFYRISITATADTTDTFSQVFAYLFDGDANSISFTGTGSNGLFLSCGQLEEHGTNERLTSYIPTTSANVTRAAETTSITGFSETAFNTGALLVEYDTPSANADMDILYAYSTGELNTILLKSLGGAAVANTKISGTTTTITASDSNTALESSNILGYSYKALGHILTFNDSGIFGRNTSIGVPTGMNILKLGSATFNGHVIRVLSIPDTQIESQLQALTSTTLSQGDLLTITELYVSHIFGEFQGGETLSFTDKNGQLYETESVYNLYAGLNIDSAGSGYAVNDRILIKEAVTGITVAEGFVSNITTTGGIKTTNMTNFGILLDNDNTVITIESELGTGASLSIIPGTLGEFAGRWVGTYGQLSSDKRLQDNLFYQDYSYVLKSNVNVDTFNEYVKEIIHPAGFKMFGELFSEEASVDSIDISGLTLAVIKTFEFLKSISLTTGVTSVIHILERIVFPYLENVSNIEDIHLSQRQNVVLDEYDTIILADTFANSNEGTTPNIDYSYVGSLTARPAIYDVRKFSMIQTIES